MTKIPTLQYNLLPQQFNIIYYHTICYRNSQVL